MLQTWTLLGLTIHTVLGQYMPSTRQNTNYPQQAQQQPQFAMQQQGGGYGQFNTQPSTGGSPNYQDQQQQQLQQGGGGMYGQISGGSGYGGVGGPGGRGQQQQQQNQGSSGRGMDNGNPLNKLNPNYLGPRPDYCKQPTGQFAVANDCTSFYNCHENIGWIMKCPEGLGFNEKIAACDYAEAVGCAAAAAAANARANSIQNSYSNTNQGNSLSSSSGYGAGAGTGYQQPNTQNPNQQSNGHQGNQFGNPGQGNQLPSGSGFGGTGFQAQSTDNQAPMLQGGGMYGSGSRNLVNNPGQGSMGKATWNNDAGFNSPQNRDANPGSMAVANQPPNMAIPNQPQLTPCIPANMIPVDSVQPPPRGSSINPNLNPQRNDGPPQSSLGDENGFPVIQPQIASGQNPPGRNMRPDETDNNDYSTLYGSTGPKIGRMPCQPCQQQGASCSAYPEAKCFDDVCGGCRARFFIRRSGGTTPFAEVTQLCGGSLNVSISQTDNNPMMGNNNNQQPDQDMLPKNAGLNQPY